MTAVRSLHNTLAHTDPAGQRVQAREAPIGEPNHMHNIAWAWWPWPWGGNAPVFPYIRTSVPALSLFFTTLISSNTSSSFYSLLHQTIPSSADISSAKKNSYFTMKTSIFSILSVAACMFSSFGNTSKSTLNSMI